MLIFIIIGVGGGDFPNFIYFLMTLTQLQTTLVELSQSKITSTFELTLLFKWNLKCPAWYSVNVMRFISKPSL